ncbi:hypothetical protein [Planctopirus hydrillae]|uniref:YcxB-like protein domain-containing protein n=1 Tax=Planctopirus hydrillae TaxID=1841610 RepID=A0A1C3EKE6_9PLAN|nr:hypothetical protein [Planctopirus hydrillae]ODA33717.1 hypothetical protein A6X21_18495 [Planctopirus hydrillae]
MTISSDQISTLHVCQLDNNRLKGDHPHFILHKPLSHEDGKAAYQLIIGKKKSYLFLLFWGAVITAALTFVIMQIASTPHFTAMILFLVLFGIIAISVFSGGIHVQSPFEHQFKTGEGIFEPITIVVAEDAIWRIHKKYISRFQWQHFDTFESNLNGAMLRTRGTVGYFVLGHSQLENAEDWDHLISFINDRIKRSDVTVT